MNKFDNNSDNKLHIYFQENNFPIKSHTKPNCCNYLRRYNMISVHIKVDINNIYNSNNNVNNNDNINGNKNNIIMMITILEIYKQNN